MALTLKVPKAHCHDGLTAGPVKRLVFDARWVVAVPDGYEVRPVPAEAGRMPLHRFTAKRLSEDGESVTFEVLGEERQ